MNDKDVERLCRRIKIQNELDWLKTDIIAAEDAKTRAIVIFSAMREWNRAQEAYRSAEPKIHVDLIQEFKKAMNEEEKNHMERMLTYAQREKVGYRSAGFHGPEDPGHSPMKESDLPEAWKPPKNSNGIKI